MINDNDLESFGQGMGWLEQSKRAFKKDVTCALSEARLRRGSNKAATSQGQLVANSSRSFERPSGSSERFSLGPSMRFCFAVRLLGHQGFLSYYPRVLLTLWAIYMLK